MSKMPLAVRGYRDEWVGVINLEAGRDLYVAVQARAKASCDLVLYGSLPVDELAHQIVTAKDLAIASKSLISVAGDARLERATSGSGDQRSIQLS